MLPRIFLCSLVIAQVHADFTIVQRVEGSANSGQMMIRMKGDLVRADIAPQVSTITNVANDDVTTLQHASKVFIRLPGEQAKAILERANQQQKAVKAEAPTPTPTGRKEKVGSRLCEVLTWSAGEVRATDWVAKDFPNAPTLVAALERFQAAGLSGAAAALQPRLSALPGMLIKRELTIGAQKTTTTLLSVSEAPIDDAVFSVPATYKEQPAPLFQFAAPK